MFQCSFDYMYIDLLLYLLHNSMSTEPPLQLLSPQRNVPVLGADIIAQTFAGNITYMLCLWLHVCLTIMIEKQTPNDFHSPMETQTGVINGEINKVDWKNWIFIIIVLADCNLKFIELLTMRWFSIESIIVAVTTTNKNLAVLEYMYFSLWIIQ